MRQKIFTLNKDSKSIKDSKKAYEECLKDDRLEIAKNITDSKYAFWYCLGVKNRPEVRKYTRR